MESVVSTIAIALAMCIALCMDGSGNGIYCDIAGVDVLYHNLAISRAVDFLAQFKPRSNVTPTQWGSYLEELFTTIYTRLYSGTPYELLPNNKSLLNGNAVIDCGHEPASIASQLDIGGIFYEFAHSFFDQNGFFATTDVAKTSQKLAVLYYNINNKFSGSIACNLVLRVFLTAMGRMRGFREKLGGIDLRRLSAENIKQLMAADSAQKIAEVLAVAMDSSKVILCPDSQQTYFSWPDLSVSIAGNRFIAVNADSDVVENFGASNNSDQLVVLINGTLVPIEQFRKRLLQHIRSGALLADFVIPAEEITAKLRYIESTGIGYDISKEKYIDYTDVTKSVPPICMSLHPITKLTYWQHRQLAEYLNAQHQVTIEDLADLSLAKELLQDATIRNSKWQVCIKLASERMNAIMHDLRARVIAEIENIPHADTHNASGLSPHFVMTMGGSASGKSSNSYFKAKYRRAKGDIGVEYVVASLDEARAYSDIYHILVAAGHHADDYEAVNIWASSYRSCLCEEALKRRCNVIYDGSGIDYNARYAPIVQKFRDAGYTTEIVATDCLLIINNDRRDKYKYSAIDRIIKRAGYCPHSKQKLNLAGTAKELTEYRSLPWRVAINKHINFPTSLLAALADRNMQKIVVVDNAGEVKNSKVMAESFIIKSQKLALLWDAQAKGNLAVVLQQDNLLPDDKDLNPPDDMQDIAFLAADFGDYAHILVITDINRFVDIVEKRQFNPNASGIDNLTFIKSDLSFMINEIDKPNGKPYCATGGIECSVADMKMRCNEPGFSYMWINSG